jgi:NADH-quinone oxidoreductase subunit C
MSALDFAAIAALVPGTEARTSDNGQPWLLVPAADLPRVATLLRDDPALRFDIAVVYYLHSLTHRHHLTLKVLAPRDACSVPSVGGIWAAAVYFEREVFDLLGVQFTGHPSLKRIMCPDDWIGHPLRKDYVYPSAYNDVPCLREGQKFEAPPARGGTA